MKVFGYIESLHIGIKDKKFDIQKEFGTSVASYARLNGGDHTFKQDGTFGTSVASCARFNGGDDTT